MARSSPNWPPTCVTNVPPGAARRNASSYCAARPPGSRSPRPGCGGASPPPRRVPGGGRDGPPRPPPPSGLAALKRPGAWPFLSWCFAEGHLTPDLDLLLAKDPGDLYRQWRTRNPGDVQLITKVASRFGWSANWTRDVSRGGLALICLTAGKTLRQLGDEDFAEFARALAQAPAPATTAGCTTPPARSACTRPATSCGSASSRRGWPGPARRPWISASRRSASPRSARPRCAT